MTTTVHAPTSQPTAAPELDLDTRLALADAAMNVRLDHAQLTFAVNTAHLPDTPVKQLAPRTAPPYGPAPVAGALASIFLDALRIIDTRGWTRSTLRDNNGAVCAYGALRAAATSRHQADDACVLLLDVIQQRYQADTVPSWNDGQTSVEPIRWALATAHNHAATRGI
ncbi:hypothetical protein [Streptomyces sp. NPDC088258]|uniref:DUF6197 family protein n=1 Tax=Streptomyces sp. NPDC088258 TaxID=3365849 RepID=UPI00380E12A9